MNNFVSVIIPHKNDSKRLKLCVESLNNQTFSRDNYEVIVVDNGSDKVHFDKITDFLKTINFSLITEPQEGSYAARNKGLEIAKGDIIAFTDSDCIPNHNWIEMGVNNLKEINNCDIVGGKIELIFENKDTLNVIELYEKIHAFKQEEYVNKFKFSATANLFTSVSIVSDVGKFDDSFKSSGDKEWCQRAINKGYNIIYSENVIVKHPSRSNLNDYVKKIKRIVGGQYSLNKKNGVSSKILFFRNLLDLLPPVVSIYRLFQKDDFKKIKNNSIKLKILSMFLLIRYLTVYENFRLLIGMETRN